MEPNCTAVGRATTRERASSRCYARSRRCSEHTTMLQPRSQSHEVHLWRHPARSLPASPRTASSLRNCAPTRHSLRPSNVKLLLEGQEEVLSPHLGAWLAQPNISELLRSDYVVSTDGMQPSLDVPGIMLGNRGAASIELEVSTANRDVHSGMYGGYCRRERRRLLQPARGVERGAAAAAGHHHHPRAPKQLPHGIPHVHEMRCSMPSLGAGLRYEPRGGHGHGERCGRPQEDACRPKEGGCRRAPKRLRVDSTLATPPCRTKSSRTWKTPRSTNHVNGHILQNKYHTSRR
ncbi:peptidase M20 [Pseudoscourfieldia marina]